MFRRSGHMDWVASLKAFGITMLDVVESVVRTASLHHYVKLIG